MTNPRRSVHLRVLTTVALLGGCEAPPEEEIASEELVDATADELQPETDGSADETDDSICSLGDDVGPKAEVLPVETEFIAADPEIEIFVPDEFALDELTVAVDGTLSTGVEIIRRDGVFEALLSELPQRPADGGVVVRLQVDRAALDLDVPQAKHGSLYLHVTLLRGEERVADLGSSLTSYHRDDDGSWRIYGESSRNGKYAKLWEETLSRDLAVVAVANQSPDRADRDENSTKPDEEGDRLVGRDIAAPSGTPRGTVSGKFCMDVLVEYVDVGNEDYWYGSGPISRSLLGAQYNLYHSGEGYIGSGYLSGSTGCTTSYQLEEGGWYRVNVYSNGRVNGNDLTVYRNSSYYQSSGSEWFVVAQSSPNPVTFHRNIYVSSDSQQDGWQVYRAITRSMWLHSGGISNEDYVARVITPPEGGGGAYTSGQIQISPSSDWTKRKYLITHEYGHALAYQGGGVNFAPDCSISTSTGADPDCPSASGGDHKMWSVEWNSCAASEGWAHFVAADAWNAHNDQCHFNYWRDRDGMGGNDEVTCNPGSSLYPLQFDITECGETTGDNSVKGVEVDWMRTFWGVHTGIQTTASNMGDTIDWLQVADAIGFGQQNTEWRLDEAADSIGGNLETNWYSASDYHGL